MLAFALPPAASTSLPTSPQQPAEGHHIFDDPELISFPSSPSLRYPSASGKARFLEKAGGQYGPGKSKKTG